MPTILLPVVAGFILSLQIAAEQRFRAVGAGLAPSLFLAFLTATLCCLVWCQMSGVSPLAALKNAPAAFVGGPARILYALCITAAIPGLGYTERFALAVAGQLLGGALLDFASGTQPLTVKNLLGIAALIASLWFLLDKSK